MSLPNVTKSLPELDYDEVLFQCRCGANDYLEFSIIFDDSLSVTHIGEPKSLWELIVDWWKRGRRAVSYFDVLLDTDDRETLANAMEEWAEKLRQKEWN